MDAEHRAKHEAEIEAATKLLRDNGKFVLDRENWYDRKDSVRLVGGLNTGMLKVAVYEVRDPEDGTWSTPQYHMTYGNTVMAVMGEEGAKLFARVVNDNVVKSPLEKEAARYVAARLLIADLENSNLRSFQDVVTILNVSCNDKMLSDDVINTMKKKEYK